MTRWPRALFITRQRDKQAVMRVFGTVLVSTTRSRSPLSRRVLGGRFDLFIGHGLKAAMQAALLSSNPHSSWRRS
jgi:hypothetical protein